MLKMSAIILFVRPYKFTNQTTGEIIQGAKIQYYPQDNFSPIEDDDGVKGKEIMYDNLPYYEVENIKQVPGVYDMACEMGTVKDSNGRTVSRLQVKNVNFVSGISSE